MIELRIEVVPRQGLRRQGYIGWAERVGEGGEREFVRRTLRHSHEVVCRGDLETWAKIHKEFTGEEWEWETEEAVVVLPGKDEVGEGVPKGKRVKTLEERKAWGEKMRLLREAKRGSRTE